MNDDPISAITSCGVLVIARLASTRGLDDAVAASVRGGAGALEVTLNTPGALDWIGPAVQRWADQIILGVGTVRSAQQAHAAIDAGAEFLVSPHLNHDIMKVAIAEGVPAVPGALSPTEVSDAATAGAELVKLFPANTGGPEYIANLTAAIDDIPLLATGGVTPELADAYIAAGASAVALGAAVLNDSIVARGAYDDMTAAVHATVAAITTERAEPS